MNAVFAVAVTELRIALRNRWIVSAILIMTAFSLILVVAGSAPAGAVNVDRLTVTVSSLATLCVYLVPLLALLLSYDAVSGELDRGTMALVLTYPVARTWIIAGKFVAQFVVVVAAVVIGTGSAAVAIAAFGGDVTPGLVHLFRLQWTAIVLGAVFLAIGNLISTSTRQSGAAASLAVGVWIVAVVMIDVALLGAVVASDGGFFTKSVFPWLLALSPTDGFRLYNLVAIETHVGTTALSAPGNETLPQWAPIAAMATWFAVAAIATIGFFRRIEP